MHFKTNAVLCYFVQNITYLSVHFVQGCTFKFCNWSADNYWWNQMNERVCLTGCYISCCSFKKLLVSLQITRGCLSLRVFKRMISELCATWAKITWNHLYLNNSKVSCTYFKLYYCYTRNNLEPNYCKMFKRNTSLHLHTHVLKLLFWMGFDCRSF